MHTQAQNSFAYYGEQAELAYTSQTRTQDTMFWPQDVYSSSAVQWPHTLPANSWATSNQNIYSSQYPTTYAQWGATGVTAQGSPYPNVPRQTYINTSAVPDQEPSRWQPAEPVAIHTYERLPSAEKGVVDAWLEKDAERRVYRCRGNGCGKEFSSKDNARVHVHGKHLGESKLFRCVQCRTEFASEDGAKRHRDTATTKTFSCPYCSNTYARKDYRDLHQKKCTSRRAY